MACASSRSHDAIAVRFSQETGPQRTRAVKMWKRDRGVNLRSRFRLPLLGSNQDSPDPESGVLPVTPRGSAFDCHGAEGDRTPDLCSAIAALSQLSYSPGVPPSGP